MELAFILSAFLLMSTFRSLDGAVVGSTCKTPALAPDQKYIRTGDCGGNGPFQHTMMIGKVHTCKCDDVNCGFICSPDQNGIQYKDARLSDSDTDPRCTGVEGNDKRFPASGPHHCDAGARFLSSWVDLNRKWYLCHCNPIPNCGYICKQQCSELQPGEIRDFDLCKYYGHRKQKTFNGTLHNCACDPKLDFVHCGYICIPADPCTKPALLPGQKFYRTRSHTCSMGPFFKIKPTISEGGFNCSCYHQDCGYICTPNGIQFRTTTPPWDRSTASHCVPPTLSYWDRWEENRGCSNGSSYFDYERQRYCKCHNNCGYICKYHGSISSYPPWQERSTSEWTETSATTGDPWNRYTSRSYCQIAVNLYPWQRWIRDPGCNDGSHYYNQSSSESCNCHQRCGYICEYSYGSTNSPYPPSEERFSTIRPWTYWTDEPSRASTISPWDRSTGSHCVPPTLSYWDRWEENRGCSKGSTYWDDQRSHCYCYKNCGYICENHYGSTNSPYPPWEERSSATEEPWNKLSSPTSGWIYTTNHYCPGPPTLRPDQRWEPKPGCYVHSSYKNNFPPESCNCYQRCGYICTALPQPTYYPPWERSSATPEQSRASTTSEWAETSGATQEPWNRYTSSSYCQRPNLSPWQRWIQEPGCQEGPCYYNRSTLESCNCYQSCGYICSSDWLSSTTWFPPWTVRTTPTPHEHCTKPTLRPGQKYYKSKSHNCSMGQFFRIKPTISEGGFNCSCYHQDCGYICTPNGIQFRTTTPPWDRSTGSQPHCVPPTLSWWNDWEENRGCSNGSSFWDYLRSRYCSCYNNCGYICEYYGSSSSSYPPWEERSTTTEWAEISATTGEPWNRYTSGSYCPRPNLNHWQRWIRDPGCHEGSYYYNRSTSESCNCHQRCGYICEYNYGSPSPYSPWQERSSATPPWTYWTDEPTRASTIPPWYRSTGSQPHCVPPTLSYWDRWEDNQGCSKGSSYPDYRRSRYCTCYKNCGYICKYDYGSSSSSYPPWEERYSTTPARNCREPLLGPGEIFERSNETCWNGYPHQTIKHGRWYNCTCHNDICGYVCSPLYNDELSSPTPGWIYTTNQYCPGPPTLRPDQRWEPSPGCYFRPPYKNEFPPESCTCYQRCGYICTALPQSTYYPPWERSSATQGRSRASTTSEWAETSGATQEPWNRYTSGSYCPRPNLNAWQRWIQEPGCHEGPYYYNRSTSESCNCYQSCGYICSSHWLSSTTWIPPWSVRTTTAPHDDCTKPTLRPGQKYYKSKSHNCSMGQFFRIKPTISEGGFNCSCYHQDCGYICTPNGIQFRTTTPPWDRSTGSKHHCVPPTLSYWNHWEENRGCSNGSTFWDYRRARYCSCYNNCGYICEYYGYTSSYSPWEERSSTIRPWTYWSDESTRASTIPPWDRSTGSYCVPPTLSYWDEWEENRGCSKGSSYSDYRRSLHCNCYKNCGYICEYHYGSTNSPYPPWERSSATQGRSRASTTSEWAESSATTGEPWNRYTSGSYCPRPNLNHWQRWIRDPGCHEGSYYYNQSTSESCNCHQRCGYICEYYGSPSPYSPWEERYSTTPARHCSEPFLRPREIFERSNETCSDGYSHQTIKHGRWYNCTCQNDICGYICSPLYDELSSPTPGSRTYWTDEPTSPRTSPRPSTWDPWWYSTNWHPWTYWTDEPTRPSASPRPRTNCTSLLRPKRFLGGTETCIPGYYFELTIHGDKFNCTCDHTFEECGYICEPVDNNLGLCSTPTLLPGQTYLATKNCPVGDSFPASNSGQGITCNCDRRKCGYVCSPNGVQYTTPDWNGSPYPYGKK